MFSSNLCSINTDGLVLDPNSYPSYPEVSPFPRTELKYKDASVPSNMQSDKVGDLLELEGLQKASWFSSLQKSVSGLELKDMNEIKMFLFLDKGVDIERSEGGYLKVSNSSLYKLGSEPVGQDVRMYIGHLVLSTVAKKGPVAVIVRAYTKSGTGTGERTNTENTTQNGESSRNGKGEIYLDLEMQTLKPSQVGTQLRIVSYRNPMSKEEAENISLLTAFDPLEFALTEKKPYRLRLEAIGPLLEMLRKAEEEGIERVQIRDTYRGYNQQADMFNSGVNKRMGWGYDYEKAFKQTEIATAYPGTSEHHDGLTADLTFNDYPLEQNFSKTSFGKWLQNNSYKYGFVIRYPAGKDEATTKFYEPWHVRFVGEAAANLLKRYAITLDEFHEYLNENIYFANSYKDTNIYSSTYGKRFFTLYLESNSLNHIFIGNGIVLGKDVYISEKGDGGLILYLNKLVD